MLAVLDVLERQQLTEPGWLLDRHDVLPAAGVERAQGLGLVEVADIVERAELSARAGGPVRWAARLTPRGRDVLAYARQRPTPSDAAPAPGQQLVELRPSQMTAVRATAVPATTDSSTLRATTTSPAMLATTRSAAGSATMLSTVRPAATRSMVVRAGMVTTPGPKPKIARCSSAGPAERLAVEQVRRQLGTSRK
jgi:hypothetical protein